MTPAQKAEALVSAFIIALRTPESRRFAVLQREVERMGSVPRGTGGMS